MLLRVADLASFWEAAARPVPVTIIGAGRWGRVWATVLSSARQGGRGTTIVARHNYPETKAWAAKTPEVHGIAVVSSVEKAFGAVGRPEIAIVASRPADHLRDALAALSGGLHVLVEKPIASKAADAASMMQAAATAGRLLGVGTEFAFLPAFHRIAFIMRTQTARDFAAVLEWEDPQGEVRHGSGKAIHDEISVLEDLLAHAFSVFSILAPSASLVISNASLAPDRRSGYLEIRDDIGRTFRLICHAAGSARRRILRIDANGVRGNVDFAEVSAKITVAGEVIDLPVETRYMSSTLRLEFGAFVAQLTGDFKSSLATSRFADLVALQRMLESFVCPCR